MNPSFEESGGWSSLTTDDGEAWAPPHGTRFATLLGCDDAVTMWMARNEYTCESYETSNGLDGRCGDDAVWVAAAACRRTCWDAGKAYAGDDCDAARISQTVSTIEAGATYELTVFARSVVPAGSSATTRIRAKLGSAEVSLSLDPVAPSPMLGNDDGGNVFFDGEYRLQASEHVMFQKKNRDPISDAWEVADEELPPIANYAPGPIHTPQGLRALYGTGGSCARPDTQACDDCVDACDVCEAEGTCATTRDLPPDCNCKTAIIPVALTGEPPEYGFDEGKPVLEHSSMLKRNAFTSFFPSPLDAHLFYDGDDDRLWMSWGGWTIYATELDPTTGRLPGDPADVEVDNCMPSCAAAILSFADSADTGGDAATPEGWEGDALSKASYVEGPALYKRDGFWYAFGSYRCRSVGAYVGAYAPT